MARQRGDGRAARRAQPRVATCLFPTKGKNWMIHRMDPPPEGYEPMPERIRPMLAKPGELPASDEGWAYEFKWDGVRAVVYVDGGRVRAVTRNDKDLTDFLPRAPAAGRVPRLAYGDPRRGDRGLRRRGPTQFRQAAAPAPPRGHSAPSTAWRRRPRPVSSPSTSSIWKVAPCWLCPTTSGGSCSNDWPSRARRSLPRRRPETPRVPTSWPSPASAVSKGVVVKRRDVGLRTGTSRTASGSK